MTTDRSLDEFLDTGKPADEERASPTDPRTDEDGTTGTSEMGDEGSVAARTTERAADQSVAAEGTVTDEDDGPSRPVSTYVWSPDGGACDACRETVRERWRDGERLVCADCKEW